MREEGDEDEAREHEDGGTPDARAAEVGEERHGETEENELNGSGIEHYFSCSDGVCGGVVALSAGTTPLVSCRAKRLAIVACPRGLG